MLPSPHAMSQREKLLGLLINEQLLVLLHFYPDVLPHYKWKNVTGGKLVNQVIMGNSLFSYEGVPNRTEPIN